MTPEEHQLLTFLVELESDVTSESQPSGGSPADFREQAFTRLVADELESSGILESPVACHYESGRGSGIIKASGYSVPDEDSRLDLLITIYDPGPHESVPSLVASDVDRAFNKLERFLSRALDGLHKQLDPALPERYMAERICGIRENTDRINFLLITNCRLAVRREKQRSTDVCGFAASYDVWDVERLRRLRESGASYEALNVELRSQAGGGLPCVKLDGNSSGYHTCIAIFPGKLLHDLYEEHGSRLLELNVRSYLQAKGKINKGILETLRSDPVDFMAYNNGITVVAEEIVFGPLTSGTEGIVELRGMQIVNGGQTTASIHRAAKDFQADLSRVYVQGKIVAVDPARFNEVVPYIARYANSQNKVTDPDLQANHRYHVGIERAAKREWAPGQTSKWFYERARGSYQTAKGREARTDARRREFERRFPQNQCFTKEDLARYENTWRGLPHVVNRGRQKNFTHFMTLVKTELGELPENWEPSTEEYRRMIGRAILFRDVQRLVAKLPEISAYRINIVIYTVAMLAERTARRIDLDAIWQRQRISPTTENVALDWAPKLLAGLLTYAQSQPVHMDNVLKSQATWEHLLSLPLVVPPGLQKELCSAALSGNGRSESENSADATLTNDDHNNIARCMELGATEWLDIVNWGGTSRELKKWQLGIATTLASYAAQGWERRPSAKQAKHGAVMIEAARAAQARR